MSDVIAACMTCGMPVRVVVDDAREVVVEVISVCGHPTQPPASTTKGGEDGQL